MKHYSKIIQESEYQPITYNFDTGKYQVYYKKEDYYDISGKVDGMCYVTYIEFDHCPNSIELKSAISEQYDSLIKDKILYGFYYYKPIAGTNDREDKFWRIYLSPENQMNLWNNYAIAKNMNGINLPYTVKCGDGYNIEYLEINTIAEFEDLLFQMSEFITQCQKDGWQEKDAINFSLFDIETRKKYQQVLEIQNAINNPTDSSIDSSIDSSTGNDTIVITPEDSF